MFVAVGKGLATMGLVLFRFTPEALQHLALMPIAAAELQGSATDEIVISLAAVFKVNDLGHWLHALSGLCGHYTRESFNLKIMVLPEFAWVNVYKHRYSALTLPGQGELWNKEPEFALGQSLCAKRAASGEHAPLCSSLTWPTRGFLCLPSKFRKNQNYFP